MRGGSWSLPPENLRSATRGWGEADYQWNLFVSLWQTADLAEEGGKAQLERALGILRPLDAAGVLNPDRREWIPRLEERLRD